MVQIGPLRYDRRMAPATGRYRTTHPIFGLVIVNPDRTLVLCPRVQTPDAPPRWVEADDSDRWLAELPDLEESTGWPPLTNDAITSIKNASSQKYPGSVAPEPERAPEPPATDDVHRLRDAPRPTDMANLHNDPMEPDPDGDREPLDHPDEAAEPESVGPDDPTTRLARDLG